MVQEESKDTKDSAEQVTKQGDTAATRETEQQQNDEALSEMDNKNQSDSEKSIRLVVQRFRKASLLIDESETVTVGTDGSFSGILVYTSFAKSATKQKVLQAAKTIMNLPILTRGLWGDGSEPVSVLDMASAGGAGVMLVPQANLISKVSICCIVL